VTYSPFAASPLRSAADILSIVGLSKIAHRGSANESIKTHAASYQRITSTKKKNITIIDYSTHHDIVATCVAQLPPNKINKHELTHVNWGKNKN
jgi:hypothetical protein